MNKNLGPLMQLLGGPAPPQRLQKLGLRTFGGNNGLLVAKIAVGKGRSVSVLQSSLMGINILKRQRSCLVSQILDLPAVLKGGASASVSDPRPIA
jgi:hypothetical protein